MSFPAGVTTCTVTAGSTLDFFGNTGSVSVTVTPVLGGNASAIIWAATGQPLGKFSGTYAAADGFPASFAVPHVNQTGFIDQAGNAYTNWAYSAVVTMTVSGKSVQRTINFQPLVGQALVDLDLLPDGTVTQGVATPIPPVLSVNGMTGAVVVSGGEGGGAVSSVNARTGDVVIVKADVGLGNVNNTSDANKPVSTAQSAAIALRALDTATVHNSGNESISGVKAFAASPTGPDPTTAAQLATKQYVDDNAGVVSDADASTKGILRLTGALGGTADAPTTPTAVHLSGAESVSGVKTFASSPIVPTPTTGETTAAASVAFVLANGGTPADASTTVKGIVKLAGDLAGTALLPTVPALAGKLTTTNNLSEIATAGGAAQLAAAKNLAILDVSGLIFVALIPDFSASKINAGSLDVDRVAVGTTIKLKKVAGVWPTRPTRSTNYSVEWVGAAPSPPIDSTHAITDVDYWLEDAS